MRDRGHRVRRPEQRDFAGARHVPSRVAQDGARFGVPGQPVEPASASAVPSAWSCSAASCRSSSDCRSNGGGGAADRSAGQRDRPAPRRRRFRRRGGSGHLARRHQRRRGTAARRRRFPRRPWRRRTGSRAWRPCARTADRAGRLPELRRIVRTAWLRAPSETTTSPQTRSKISWRVTARCRSASRSTSRSKYRGIIGTSASPHRMTRCAGETTNGPNRYRGKDTRRASYRAR